MDMSVENVAICCTLLISLCIWIRWRRAKLKVFAELGIPGPPPHFLFGNILELNKKNPLRCQKEWIEKYGKIVGYYHGLKPVLLVADLDLLKKILIKDFHLFCDRPENIPLRVRSFLDCIIPASAIMDNILPNLKGEKWKEVRSILSPTFSASKLKMMIPAVDQVCDIAVSVLEEQIKTREVVNIYDVLQRLTLDITCAQAFEMDINSLNNPTDPLLRSSRVIFDLPFDSKIIFFGRCFPELGIFAMTINFLSMFIRNKGYIPPLKITEVLDRVIKQRRNTPGLKKRDLLQWLIDASTSDSDSEKKNLNTEGLFDSPKFLRRKQTLTDLEVNANALVVFLAGYETTSSALGYAFHFLAKYPKLQQEIQKEIDLIYQKEGKVDYHSVGSFQLMERFLLETMRFYSPTVSFVVRVSVADVDYGYVRIPKGMEINVPVDYLHRSDEYWDQPEEFNPDRFLPENVSKRCVGCYMAFGIGPRNCIGQRMVSITTKMVLARILNKFTVEPVEFRDQVKSKLKVFTMTPEEVLVKLKPRVAKEY